MFFSGGGEGPRGGVGRLRLGCRSLALVLAHGWLASALWWRWLGLWGSIPPRSGLLEVRRSGRLGVHARHGPSGGREERRPTAMGGEAAMRSGGSDPHGVVLWWRKSGGLRGSMAAGGGEAWCWWVRLRGTGGVVV